MARKRVDPSKHVALETSGAIVYHTLRWDNSSRREFWFTLLPDRVDGEARNVMEGQFDARDIPTEFKTGDKPIDWVRHALEAGFDLSTIELRGE